MLLPGCRAASSIKRLGELQATCEMTKLSSARVTAT
jgi:hypothetical protein